jgi:hypothetical protein
MEIFWMAIAITPTFVRVTVFVALVLPTGTLPKLMVLAERETTVPVPESASVSGLPGALSAMLRAALRKPGKFGLKVTLIVQLAPTARLAAQDSSAGSLSGLRR